MAKYKIVVNGHPDHKTMKEFHLNADNRYHRLIFENGIAYTDSDGVAEYFRTGRLKNDFGVCEIE